MYKIIKTEAVTNLGNRFIFSKVLIETDDKKTTYFYLRYAEPYAIIIPVLDRETVLMIEQQRIGPLKISLEFPMGVVKGSQPLEMAIDELKEETGYRSNNIKEINRFYISPGWSNQQGHVFVAKDLVEGKQELEPYEYIEVKKIKIKDIPGLIKNGTIFDASTIVAWQYFVTSNKT